jgi:uncharacterized protein (TIGR02099 family)
MRQNALRSALYHRFHRLLPFIAHPATRALGRGLVWAFWLVYFGFILLVLALRYSILPNIESYRGDIEHRVSQALGQTIHIGRIEASWDGINPDLTLFDVQVADAKGRPALAFSRVETILSWWSVPQLQLKLALLRIDQPTLHLRRDTDGRIFIAGIPLAQESGNPDAADWILAQRRIRINGATVVWEDALRAAPALALQEVNFSLDNNGSRHRFGLTAVPSAEVRSKIDLRGDFRGRDLDALESWKGQVFVQIDEADLAVWRTWVDYPVALESGRGALRTWVSFAGGHVRELTTDLALREVRLHLADDLSSLNLEKMSGRISAKFPEPGAGIHNVEISGRRIELSSTAHKATSANEAVKATRIEIPASDFDLQWQTSDDNKPLRGSATAGRLDLEPLAGLAAYLPLEASVQQMLKDFAPRGRLSDLRATWRSDSGQLAFYALKARFDDLALQGQGSFPGFSGLSGLIDASEQGGSARLATKKSSIGLPSLFPEPQIALDSLSAQAKWTLKKGVLDAELIRAEFAGPDAAGSAQGHYRNTGQGPGVINLTAALSRGEGRAVWRYMPQTISANARHWLREALKAGTASNAKLILKGDLKHFPFLDKKTGQFLVTLKAKDVLLDYASGWPPISGLAGDLRFEGAGMTLEVKQGTMLGAHIPQGHAVIPDFDAPLRVLTVKARAEGPTTEFLKFIEQSPVGERIDHFTEAMRATGDGRLDIGLSIPLDPERVGESKVEGNYRLLNNEVRVDTDFPAFRQVNGSIQFGSNDLHIPEIKATLFDGPIVIKGGTQRDGKVLISAEGSLSAAQLGQQLDWPLFEKLSGGAKYKGEVRIKKRSADLLIDSNLVGLASTLPEPFKKAADDVLPVHFEKIFLPSVAQRSGEPLLRDQIDAKLGNTLALQIIRRKRGEDYVPERGAIAIGRALQLPEHGLTLGVTSKRLDADQWRQILRSKPGTSQTEETPPPSPAFSFSAINLKADELLLLGRPYTEVDLSAALSPALWQIQLASHEASGDLKWENAGRGKLTARLKKMRLEPVSSHNGPNVPTLDATEQLPELDIVADDFSIGSRRFGRLEVQARNEGPLWRLDKIQLANPYGNLSGSGQWQLARGKNRTQLDFKLESSDIGKLLDRLGYPGAVRGGTAAMEGKIGWNGSPAGLDYETLGGEIKLEASKGQFAKLDPGAGKLLGLISLQALPRRITLDFRDIFSDGLAFDSIASQLSLKNGVMRTDQLLIDGPAARIVMRGETDLQHETQRLNVNVQPDLGSTAALGIALVNPLIGVATLLAHKILQNPLNQMFGFDYRVTGTWDDPKVEKLSRLSAPSTTAPRLPNVANPTGDANAPPQP